MSDMQVAAISALGDKIMIAAIAACGGWFFAKLRSEKK